MKTIILILGILFILETCFAHGPNTKIISRRKLDPRWVERLCAAHEPSVGKRFQKRQSMESDSEAEPDSSSSSSSSPSMMNTLKSYLKRIPQINFYSSIPNAVGVVGQGFSVLEKISTALGTPLPYWIGSLPVVVFGIALVFIPDLTTLNLPGFYPSGAGENDPLSAFPPLPNFDDLPDVDLSLSPDNIPPRIIPPTNSNSNSIDIPLTPPADGPFNPTNPESFDAPRRRIFEQNFHKRNLPQTSSIPL